MYTFENVTFKVSKKPFRITWTHCSTAEGRNLRLPFPEAGGGTPQAGGLDSTTLRRIAVPAVAGGRASGLSGPTRKVDHSWPGRLLSPSQNTHV